MPYEALNKRRITAALLRLGELAVENGSILEVSLYGGAVFTLVYGSRDSTKDIDAIVHPSALSRRLALQVAREQALPEDWLNDDVRFFLAVKEAKQSLNASAFGPGLQVSVPTAAYLLAMKLRACRSPLPGYSGDYGDIAFLLAKMEIPSLAEAESVFSAFFPRDSLSDAAVAFVRQSISTRTGS
jgi:hypothetical protein